MAGQFLQLIDFAIMIFASAFPLYLASYSRSHRSSLFYLSILLGGLALVHSLYHLSYFYGLELMGAFFQAVSVLLLIVFGSVLLRVKE